MDDSELRSAVTKHSQILAELSRELQEIGFSYKVEEKPSRRYWEKRIAGFEGYIKASMAYYSQAYCIMGLVNREQSQRFLLRTSRMRQLASSLAKTMGEVMANPSMVDSKDRQQSKWSREVRDRLFQQSQECLRHERDMNGMFREFYEKNLSKMMAAG